MNFMDVTAAAHGANQGIMRIRQHELIHYIFFATYRLAAANRALHRSDITGYHNHIFARTKRLSHNHIHICRFKHSIRRQNAPRDVLQFQQANGSLHVHSPCTLLRLNDNGAVDAYNLASYAGMHISSQPGSFGNLRHQLPFRDTVSHGYNRFDRRSDVLR